MRPKVSRISISLSEELCKSIDVLCQQRSMSRSRLIENCLRENPKVKKCVRLLPPQMQVVQINICSACGCKLENKEVSINTPGYGVLCLKCWAQKFGEFVEKNPISN